VILLIDYFFICSDLNNPYGQMLPKYRKIGAKLPLFAQGRADLLRDGQFEEISLFAIGQRDCGLTLFQQR
jgi:hypothetical protein